MKRRNFLKLLGLFAIPTSAFAVQKQLPQETESRINFTLLVDSNVTEFHGAHRLIIWRDAGDIKLAREYTKWTDKFVMHGRYIKPGEMVTFETADGHVLHITPEFDTTGTYKTVQVITYMKSRGLSFYHKNAVGLG